MGTEHQVDIRSRLPFDSMALDALLDDAGIDILLVTSKHNIQYLLGGYRFFLAAMDAAAVSRYLPILVYPRGRPELASYVGHVAETFEVQNGRFWMPKTVTTEIGSTGAIKAALAHVAELRDIGLTGDIGIESSFMPVDAADLLREDLPSVKIVNAYLPLERLRIVKTSDELDKIRKASERVVDAMMATFDELRPGMTKNDVVALLKRLESERDLTFEYCLIAAGGNQNRAPTDQVLKEGDVISLDSGGAFEGYLGDLSRMGVIGPVDAELLDLLAQVERFQQTARGVIKAGAIGHAIFDAVAPLLDASAFRDVIEFEAHGLGLINHEGPRLNGKGVFGYEGYDRDSPLKTGMVISVETSLRHPRRGLIKLEDTLAVTDTGVVAFGDFGRGWNQPAVLHREMEDV